jgi:hypothetical protein
MAMVIESPSIHCASKSRTVPRDQRIHSIISSELIFLPVSQGASALITSLARWVLLGL